MAITDDGRVPAADNAAAFDPLALAGQAQGALLHFYAQAVCEAVGVSMGNVVRAVKHRGMMIDVLGGM